MRAGQRLWELQSRVTDEPSLDEPLSPVSVQSPGAPASASAPALADPSMSGPVMSLRRRMGRWTLRLLRPLAAPFLRRLDLRMIAALDRSSIVGTVSAIDARLAHMAGELSAIRDMVVPRIGFDQSTATIGQSLIEIDIAIKSINRQMSETSVQWLDERMQKRMGLLSSELAQTTAGWAKTAAGLATRSDLFGRQAEMALQRMVLPIGADLAVRTESGYLLVPAENPALLVAVVETRGRLEPGTETIVLGFNSRRRCFH